jgi:hypothetical protein
LPRRPELALRDKHRLLEKNFDIEAIVRQPVRHPSNGTSMSRGCNPAWKVVKVRWRQNALV